MNTKAAQRSENDRENVLKYRRRLFIPKLLIPAPPIPLNHVEQNNSLHFLTEAVPFEKLASRDV